MRHGGLTLPPVLGPVGASASLLLFTNTVANENNLGMRAAPPTRRCGGGA